MELLQINRYEELEYEAHINDLDIVDYKFDSDRIKGLYCDGMIGINKSIKNSIEKSCVLVEELGQHYTNA